MANSAASRTLTLSRGNVLCAISLKSLVYRFRWYAHEKQKGRPQWPPLLEYSRAYWFFATTKYFATVRTNGRASVGVTCFPLRMVSKGIAAPYSVWVSFWFCDKTVPSKSIPANNPFARE